MKSCSILFPQAIIIKLISADFHWHIPFWSPKIFNIIQWQIPGEPLAARYKWCQGPVPGRGPAVEKHWFRGRLERKASALRPFRVEKVVKSKWCQREARNSSRRVPVSWFILWAVSCFSRRLSHAYSSASHVKVTSTVVYQINYSSLDGGALRGKLVYSRADVCLCLSHMFISILTLKCYSFVSLRWW